METVSKEQENLNSIRMMLYYHRAMSKTTEPFKGLCEKSCFADMAESQMEDALIDAIQCMRQVHGL